MEAGRFLGSGTDTRVVATGAALTVEPLPGPVMMSPTLSCPLVSPARTIDEGSRQRTKANFHILLLQHAINRPISQQGCAGMERFCLPSGLLSRLGQSAARTRPPGKAACGDVA
jgi:hypothetical protein